MACRYTPNSTTYNALISAYGKTMQLGKALEVYQEMLRQVGGRGWKHQSATAAGVGDGTKGVPVV